MSTKGATFLACMMIFGVSMSTILSTTLYYLFRLILSPCEALVTAIAWWLWITINWIIVTVIVGTRETRVSHKWDMEIFKDDNAGF